MRWLFFFFFFFSNLLQADNKTIVKSEEHLLLPFPVRLHGTWWEEYKSADIATLPNKIERLKKELKLIEKSDQASDIISEILPLMDDYLKKRTIPFNLADPPNLPQKSIYHLTDLTHLINLKQVTQSKLQLLHSAKKSLDTELKKQQKKLNKIIKKYKKQSDNESEKLILGLKWIQKQFDLASLKIKYQQLKRQISFKEQYLKKLSKYQNSIFLNLVLSQERLSEAYQTTAETSEKIAEKKLELQELRIEEHAIDTSNDNAILQQQLSNLRSLQTEVDIKELATDLLNARLVLAIYQLKGTVDNITRKKSRLFYKKANQEAQQLQDWFKTTEQHLKKEEAAFQAIQNNALLIPETAQGIRAIDYLHISLKKWIQQKNQLDILLRVIKERLEMTKKGGDALIEKADETIQYSWKKIRQWMTAPLFKVNETTVTTDGLLRLCFIFFMGWVFSHLIFHSLEKVNQYSGMRPASFKTLRRIISVIIMIITLLIAFSNLGLDVTKFTLFASALSIGIGFGLQNIINNFVSGIILMFERSMRVSDYIELSTGLRGTVKEINIRSTVINTNDNIDIIVPNSEFVNNSITNWTMKDRTMRIKTYFGVAYNTDKEKMRDVVIDAISALPYTLTFPESKKPQVRLIEFGDNSLNFQLVVWIKPEWMGRPGRVRAAYNWEVDSVLRENNISIPFPQREVRIVDKNIILK